MAIRRLRLRRGYCLGLDGNLQLPSESLWSAFANTYGDPNGNGGYIGNAYGNCDSYGNGNCDFIGNAYGNRNGNSYRGAEAYADAQAASYTAASALRSALAHVSSGTRDQLASPPSPDQEKVGTRSDSRLRLLLLSRLHHRGRQLHFIHEKKIHFKICIL
jgi:hypothetical protein